MAGSQGVWGYLRGNGYGKEWPSPWSDSLELVAVTFSRDLTGLIHINERGVNVIPLKQQSDKTRIVRKIDSGN